jgi:hypothetical protein
MQRPSLMAWPGSWLTSVIRSLVCVADSTSIVKVQYGDLVPPPIFAQKWGVSHLDNRTRSRKSRLRSRPGP